MSNCTCFQNHLPKLKSPGDNVPASLRKMEVCPWHWFLWHFPIWILTPLSYTVSNSQSSQKKTCIRSVSLSFPDSYSELSSPSTFSSKSLYQWTHESRSIPSHCRSLCPFLLLCFNFCVFSQTQIFKII